MYVHEKGARHLVDPSRLVKSAALVYGDLLDTLYGRLDPTPSERVHVLEDGETISIDANRTLTTVDSPGHAKHHLALHDSESGLLFAGDAVGVRLPDAGVLRPSTPPPDFDLEQAIVSLHRFAERRPTGVALAHFGLVPDPMATLVEAEEILRKWAEVAEAAFRDGRDIAEALDAAFGAELDAVDPVHKEKLETLNGIHSNAAGFRRWLEQKSNGHGHARPPASASPPALTMEMFCHGYQSWSESCWRTVGVDDDPSRTAGAIPLVVDMHSGDPTIAAPGELRSELVTALRETPDEAPRVFGGSGTLRFVDGELHGGDREYESFEQWADDVGHTNNARVARRSKSVGAPGTTTSIE